MSDDTKLLLTHIAKHLIEQMPAPHWDANKKVQWRLDVRAVTKSVQELFPSEPKLKDVECLEMLAVIL